MIDRRPIIHAGSARRLINLAFAALIAATSGCARHAPPADAAFRPAQVGDELKPFAMASLRGDTVRVGGTAVQPVTLVNVWATWCASCAEEMADLQALEHQYTASGLRVVAVSVDAGSDQRVQRFLASHQLDFNVVHDAGGSIEEIYDVPAVPTTYLVDAGGKLLWAHTGNIDPVLADVRSAIAAALATSGKAGVAGTGS